jgi:hypothetical protein
MSMFHSSESDRPSFSKMRLIEQAMKTLKQSVSEHLECETRLDRLYLGRQQTWLSQFNQLRLRVEALDASISPWITEKTNAPRLAVVSHHEDMG